MKIPNPKLYRSEILEFKTEKGIQKRLIVVARPCARKDLIEKGERIASKNNWKLR
jgi:hypothetical protein